MFKDFAKFIRPAFVVMFGFLVLFNWVYGGVVFFTTELTYESVRRATIDIVLVAMVFSWLEARSILREKMDETN